MALARHPEGEPPSDLAINDGNIPGGYSLNYGTTVQDDGAAGVVTAATLDLVLD